MKFRGLLKEFSLTQQLFGIVFLFIVFFVSFFFMFLSWNIDGFVRSQMYGILRRTQSNIVYNYRLSMPTDALYGGNDPNIVHVIFTSDGKVLASSNVDSLSKELIAELKQNALNQEINKRDYISVMDDQNILYTISRIDMTTAIASTISSSYRDEFKTTLLNSVVNIMVIVVSVLFFLLMIWVAYLIHPLNQIRAYIEKIRHGEDAELKVDRRDEIGEVASALVAMQIEIKRSEQLKEEMIHNISHDLKTPIATIKSYGESIKDGVYPYETLEKSVDVIIEHANRLEKKVQSLLLLNRLGYLASEGVEVGEIDMIDVVSKAILSLKVIRPEIKIETSLQRVSFTGSLEPWRVVVENLLDNAIRYAKSKIIIVLSENELSVFNDGPPMTDDRLGKLFKAYEKGDDGQFGLGLAIVYKVVTAYGFVPSAFNGDKGVIFKITQKRAKKVKK
jgi:two-component system, OmpR family, sensor histidine kinase CssS